MTVVTFTDFTPMPRYDGVSWSRVHIEEAPTNIGPWTQIDDISVGVDTDPTHPNARSFTTDNATLDGGWYRVIFIDTIGADQEPTAPIHYVPEDSLSYTPTLAEVGALLRTRTVESNGDEAGTFTTSTKPTGSEALHLIKQAARDVSIKVGGDVPDLFIADARNLVSLRAAMLIELTYYPEQVSADRSPYSQYKELYDEGIKTLIQAVGDFQGDDSDVEGTAGMAQFGFPEDRGGLVGWKTVM